MCDEHVTVGDKERSGPGISVFSKMLGYGAYFFPFLTFLPQKHLFKVLFTNSRVNPNTCKAEFYSKGLYFPVFAELEFASSLIENRAMEHEHSALEKKRHIKSSRQFIS